MFGVLANEDDEVSDSYRNKPTATAARAYLKHLRAAEMADWEMTGGDYVLPAFATNRFHYGVARIDRRDPQGSQNSHDDQNVVFLQSPPRALDYSEEN